MGIDLGTIIGISAFVLIIVLRVIDRDRAVSVIESKFDLFVENSNKLLDTAVEILEKSKYIKTLQPHRPELSLYLSMIANNGWIVRKPYR